MYCHFNLHTILYIPFVKYYVLSLQPTYNTLYSFCKILCIATSTYIQYFIFPLYIMYCHFNLHTILYIPFVKYYVLPLQPTYNTLYSFCKILCIATSTYIQYFILCKILCIATSTYMQYFIFPCIATLYSLCKILCIATSTYIQYFIFPL